MDKFTTALAIKKKQFRGSDNQPMVVMINMMIIEIVTPIL